MKRALAALTALALCLPAVAQAQDSARGRHEQNARLLNVAENREKRDEERGRDRDRREGDRERGRDIRGERERGRGEARRLFNFRGHQYAAVRGPEFRYPRGWGYRHWNRGEVLPRLFLAAPFFFDYGYLGLPPPPRDFLWVRYGPDALLVNRFDGRIIDVIYDAFY